MSEIFVNRRRFEIGGERMTGAEIANLLGVPEDNAVVERHGAAGELETLPLDHAFEICSGQSFLVTRQFIMGG
ncbi:multiubiquitin domain-containing protein [Caulobacter sp. S45]|uniref:multiubiquitin domain-containing protein n=1 Tax=Caulobacter sp. S45 TaxID=1641861 RepID=UPI00131BE7C8|nr:multiubiquitin domain-containing protein [Caulobacter sp. S45]